MSDNIEADIDKVLNEHGITFCEMLKLYGDKNLQVMQMSEENHKLFCKLYDEISDTSSTTKEKGTKLEKLIEVLFVKSFPSLMEVTKNSRTSTNEIDLMISWTQQAISIGLNCDFNKLGGTFLCECKNYDNKVGVTYIGKFASLLACSDTKLGIMASWNGVTGKGWRDGSGFIKKFALAEKRYILVIDKQDLLDIYQRKTNLFKMLREKYKALLLDISYDKLITKHELQNEWFDKN